MAMSALSVCLSVCLWWGVLLCVVTSQHSTNEDTECLTEDDADVDLCALKSYFSRCVLTCRNPSKGEEEDEEDMVGEDSQCYYAQLDKTLTCSKGQWVEAVALPKRQKRWLFWRRRRRSAPPPVVQYPPKIYCPGDVSVRAPAGRRSATVTWSMPTASDPNGGAPSISQTQGPARGSQFPEGSTLIQYTAEDVTKRTATCTFTVRVLVTYCSDSQRRGFGSPGTQSCSGGEVVNVYGSRCVHSCPVGYRLQGRASVYCRSDGHWDSSFPHCQVVSCGQPAEVTGGQVACPSGHTYNRQCMLQCRGGYNSSGASAITCSSSGQWQPSFQPCKDIQAPRFASGCTADQHVFSGPLQSPVTVTWPDPNVTDNSPDPVTLTSQPAKGSRLGVGIHTVNLTALDAAGNSASCSFRVTIVAKECPSVHPPANGHVNCTSGHVEGSECTFGCNLGFRVKGPSSLTCQGSRLWDGDLPTCEAIMCPSPPEVEKGSFRCPQGRQYPAVCTLACDQGYNITGATTVHCQENETWTQPGGCRDTEAPRFVRSCPSHLTPYASRLGHNTTVSWPPLQASDNSGTAVHVTCNVTSGSAFPLGATTVACTTSDAAGNSRTCQFSVTVTALQCPHPGTVFTNQSAMLYTCPDGHVHGAQCMLGCGPQHSLLGEEKVVCERETNTNPPLMKWSGVHGDLPSMPQCKVDKCPRLEPPVKGSLSCLRGPVAWDCFMQCDSGWDVSARDLLFEGYFFCNGEGGMWLPGRVPDCVMRTAPWRSRLYSQLFYMTQSCNASLTLLRQTFITRLTNSPVLKDACQVPSCVARNVQVTCGPLTADRRKRAADQWFNPRWLKQGGRKERGAASHEVVVTLEVDLSHLGTNSSLSETQLFQAVHQTQASLSQMLTALAASGELTLPPLSADVSTVTAPALHLHCPPGTLLRPLHLSPHRFSCVGCPKGHYLSPRSTQCQPCPRGHFSPQDSATSCLPCPRGLTTPSVGADHSSLCQPAAPPAL